MVAFFNYIVQNFANAIASIICSVLPKSPFIKYIDMFSYSTYLKYINYFVPIDTFISILEAWVACIAFYYAWIIIQKLLVAITGTNTDINPL